MVKEIRKDVVGSSLGENQIIAAMYGASTIVGIEQTILLQDGGSVAAVNVGT